MGFLSIEWIRSDEYPYEIYVMTNLINKKVYVGQTRQGIKKRMMQHACPSDGCPLLRNAIKKYGQENFEVLKLDCAKTREEANKKEKMWIALFDSANSDKGYNLSLGGTIGDFNADTLKKMSESKIGDKNSFFGKHHTESSKKKMSEYKKKAYQRSGHPLSRKVLCVETNTIYDCITDAQDATGANRHHITQVCKGAYGRKTAGGYHWEYV